MKELWPLEENKYKWVNIARLLALTEILPASQCGSVSSCKSQMSHFINVAHILLRASINPVEL